MQSKKEGKNKRRITRKEALEVLLGNKQEDLKLFKDFALHVFVARNGALLIADERAEVFEFGEEGDLRGLRDLHCALDEVLGMLGSKHDRERLYHVIRHGQGHSCKEENCAICHDEI